MGDLDINGRIFLEKLGVMLRTGLTCYRVEPIWKDFMNTLMNVRVSKVQGV